MDKGHIVLHQLHLGGIVAVWVIQSCDAEEMSGLGFFC